MSVRAWTKEGEGTWRGARSNVRVLLFSDVFIVAEAQQNELKLHPLTQAIPVNDLAVDSADAGAECSEYGMRVYSNTSELFLLDSDKASREQWLTLFQKLSGKKHNVKRSFIVSEITEANTDIHKLMKSLSLS
jgi:arginine deiminase